MKIWQKPVSVTHLNAVHKDTAVERLGIEFTEVGDDFITARVPVDKRTVTLESLALNTPTLAVERGSDGRWMFERWLKSEKAAPAHMEPGRGAGKVDGKSGRVASIGGFRL